MYLLLLLLLLIIVLLQMEKNAKKGFAFYMYVCVSLQKLNYAAPDYECIDDVKILL